MTPPVQEIISELPSLRRYACALTGSRATGDEYIRVALVALAEEPWRIGAGADVKAQLVRLFHHVVDALQAPAFEPPDEADNRVPFGSVKRRLLDLPIMSRKLLLLVTVEGFPLARAATLLGLPIREAERRLANARRELGGVARAAPGDWTDRSCQRGAA